MFYCDACAKKRKWPKSISGSIGRCEICGERAECNDVPSSYLPDPPAEAPAAPDPTLN